MPKPYVPNDKWSQKAQAEGYRARSVYKLQQLDERFHLLQEKQRVLDLGAAPGSWLQYVSKMIGPKGVGIGVDRTVIEPIAENIHTIQQDILETETVVDRVLDLLDTLPGRPNLRDHDHDAGGWKFDLVLSDLAPNTSGIHDVDQWRSVELSQAVVAVAARILKANGTCVIKILRGADFDEFLRTCKRDWKSVRIFRAETTRDRSTEVYLLLREFHGEQSPPQSAVNVEA